MDPSFSSSADIPFSLQPFTVPSATAAATHNHIAQAANPTPTVPATFNHPPYTEMICSAIAALKERDGSSRRAIAKYIEQVYADLPATHSTLLTQHLKRLKSSGVLVMVKKSYMLSTSTTGAEATADYPSNNSYQRILPSTSLAESKRGRGRPPKPKPGALGAQPIAQPFSQPIAQPIIQPNGQPNVGPNFQHMLSTLGFVNEPKSERRGRGRPPKNGHLEQGKPVIDKRGRGRPSKSGSLPKKLTPRRPRKPAFPVVGPGGPRIGRGRPKNQSVGVPFVNVSAAPSTPKRRGRPKKISTAASTAVRVGGVVSGKRRGRPPKIGRVRSPLKPKISSGRPVGRPQKNSTSAARSETQAVAAYEELKRKFDFFRSKVKQALVVIKRQIHVGDNASIEAALELDRLATMDISAPFREEIQPQTQPQQDLQPPREPQY